MTTKSLSSNLYTKDGFFMYSWGAYDYIKFIESRGEKLKPRTRRMLEIADLKPGMRVLEIGCGRGELVVTCALQSIYTVGMDYATDSMKMCKKTRSILLGGRKGAEFIQADAKMLPFKNREFDCIFIEDIVEHLYDWEIKEMLKEVKRVLTPNGYAVIHTLPNRWVLDYAYPFMRIFLKSLKKESRRETEKTLHINEQDIVQFANLLREAKLKYRIWVENIILEESIWRQDFIDMENHTKHYRLLSIRPLRVIYRLLGFSPLKLLCYNDIFTVIWKRDNINVHNRILPNNSIERICIFLSCLLSAKKGDK